MLRFTAILAAAFMAGCSPGAGDFTLETVCIAFEDAYVIAEGDTVTEPHAREWFERAEKVCEATAPTLFEVQEDA